MFTDSEELQEFDRDLHPPELAAVVEIGLLARSRHFLRLATRFLFGQAAAQSVNLLGNVFLVHRLSVEAYAQFGLALGFQTIFSVLMDLGLAGTVIPLVADRREDKQLVGRYVRASAHLRNRMFLLLAPLAALSFLGILYRHHWNWSLQLLLLTSVLVSLYFGGSLSLFSAPLFLFRRFTDYYVPQALFGAVRLLAYCALAWAGALGAGLAAALNALYLAATAHLVRRRSRRYFVWPEKNSSETNREILKYILPASPAIIFSAFQSQISLILISVFGGTVFTAQVAALSRIGQLFLLVLTMCAVVMEPHIARLSRKQLPRQYVSFLGFTVAACVLLVILSFRWSGVYLLILGRKYESVRGLMGWYVLSQALSLIGGVMWIMNRARKWVFWSGSILEIVLILSAQIVFLTCIGVRTTQQAVYFQFAGSLGSVLTHTYVAILGFRRGPRSGLQGQQVV